MMTTQVNCSKLTWWSKLERQVLLPWSLCWLIATPSPSAASLAVRRQPEPLSLFVPFFHVINSHGHTFLRVSTLEHLTKTNYQGEADRAGARWSITSSKRRMRTRRTWQTQDFCLLWWAITFCFVFFQRWLRASQHWQSELEVITYIDHIKKPIHFRSCALHF